MADSDNASGKPSRRGLIIGLVAVVAVVAVGLVWYLGRDTPEAVDTQRAIDAAGDDAGDDTDDTAADQDESGDDADTDTDDPGDDTETGQDANDDADDAPPDADGVWTVDTEVVEFDFDAGTGTFVGFRIAEELSTIGDTEAIGRTPVVEGLIEVAGTEVTAGSITGDLSVLVTDISNRDGATRRALDTDTYPTATFELTEPVELTAIPAVGEVVSATGVGELTLAGVTQPMEVPLEAALIDADTLIVTGSAQLLLSDHGIVAPSAPIVVSVADEGTIELQLYLTR